MGKWRFILLVAGVCCAPLVGMANQTGAAARLENGRVGSRVPAPAIPAGKGEHCVADTEFMRRNHMKLILHQRDETVLKGIRSKKYSLKECITCHAVKGADGQFLTVASPQHFCRACHDYAAVKIDCFECHASRPEAGAVAVENSTNDVLNGVLDTLGAQ